MSLRSKTLLLIFAVLAGMLTLLNVSVSNFLREKYASLENREVLMNAQRAQALVHQSLQTMLSKASDWAYWDETYEFVESKSDSYIDNNIDYDTFFGLHISHLGYFNLKGLPVLTRSFDFAAPQQEQIFPEQLASEARRWADVMAGKLLTEQDTSSGVIQLDDKAVLFVILPILRNDRSGPPRGFLLFAHELDFEMLHSYEHVLQLSVSTVRWSAFSKTAATSLLSELTANRIAYSYASESEAHALALLSDPLGQPLLVINASMPRAINEQGQFVLRTIHTLIVTLGVLFSMIMLILSELTVLRRLASVSKRVREIAESANPSLRLTVHGEDELASLSTDINGMLEALANVQSDLATAKQNAESASHARGEFVARVSHELRTPLNGIIGLADLLADTSLTDEQREYVEVMIQSSQTLLNQINDILDFSKVDAGKLEVSVAPFNLREFIERICKPLAVAASTKGCELYSVVDPRIGNNFLGDTHLLSQVLNNLLGNSLKFTEGHGVIICSVILENEHISEQVIRFAVADTGIGIEESKQKQIFEPFVQADRATTRKYGGTGLGLSICKRIVELLGGTLVLRSRPGVGSSFTFAVTLPMISSCIANPVMRIPIADKLSTNTNIHTLVVEDNPVNQKLATWILEKAGYKVTLANNGIEALDYCSKEKFDLILMDCQMPLLSGYDATQEIRKRESKHAIRRVPIIAMTADAYETAKERCLAVGMDDYVSKPIDRQSFLEKVRQWTSQNS